MNPRERLMRLKHRLRRKRAAPPAHAPRPVDEVRRLRGRVARLPESGPIIAGPFLGEVGFELLYWIPMLQWLAAEFPRLRRQLVIVSRGGVESWYGDICSQYVDVYSLIPPEELVARRAALKQRRKDDPLEAELLSAAAERLELGECSVIHPAWLYSLYYRAVKLDRHAFPRSVRKTARGIEGLGALYQPLRAPEVPGLEERLPAEFTAVRFYFSDSFPDTPENRAFAQAAIDNLARETPVVMLNNALEVDDHSDFATGSSVLFVHDLMTPETNLAVQTAVLAQAQAYVGTYGGLSYLAPFLGRPSLAFTSHRDATQSWHLELAQRLFEVAGWPAVVELRPEDVPLVQLGIRGIEVGTP